MIDKIELTLCASLNSLSQSCLLRAVSSDVVHPSRPTSPMLSVSQSSLVLKNFSNVSSLPFIRASTTLPPFAVAIKPRSRLLWVGLSGKFQQLALTCRSVEVFGSHVSFVVGASHLSQAHDLVTNGVLDRQPTNLDVSGLSHARSGTRPDRSRRVRFNVDVDIFVPSPRTCAL